MPTSKFPFVCILDNIPSRSIVEQSVLVQTTLLRPFYTSSGFYKIVLLGVRVGSQARIHLFQYHDSWLINADTVPRLLEHSGLLLSLCKDVEIVIFWERLDFEPMSKAWYLRMLISSVWERVYPTDSQINRYQDMADNFLCLSSPPVKMWQQILATWPCWNGLFQEAG